MIYYPKIIWGSNSVGQSSVLIKRRSRVQVPPAPPFVAENAGIAQMVEQLICNQQVRGSRPCAGTKILYGPLAQQAEHRTFNPRVQGSSPWRLTN